MATLTALTAFVAPKEAGLHVKFQSLAGEAVCEVSLAPGSTLEDLEGHLKTHLGIGREDAEHESFDIFAHPSQEPLDKREQADAHAELTFSRDIFVSGRKFLAAMAVEAFNPQSGAFDVNWTLRTAQNVARAEVEPFLGSLELSDLEGVKFMRVFQRLTVPSEEWNLMNLKLLQDLDPRLKLCKHVLCKHWRQVAREAATRRVVRQPSPLCLLKKNKRGNVVGMECVSSDSSFPDGFDGNLQTALRLNDVLPEATSVGSRLRALASLHWGPQIPPTPSALEQAWAWLEAGAKDEEILGADAPASAWENVRVAHVQLRLACDLGPVAVEQNLDTNFFRFVTKFLGWRLCVVRFWGLHCFVRDARDMEKEDSSSALGERATLEEHLDRAIKEAKGDGDFRGVMMLVLDLPENHDLTSHCQSLEWKHSKTMPLRFVLCECVHYDLKDSGSLLRFLHEADVRLVRLEYLRELCRKGRRLPRRQEAEKERTESGEAALVDDILSCVKINEQTGHMSTESQEGQMVEVRLVSVSHAWESMQHPDPWGFQLETVVEEMVAKHKPAGNRRQVYLFFDYLSLPQYERTTSEEKECFQRAVENMHLMYAHEAIHVFVLDKLTPADRQSKDGEIIVYHEDSEAVKSVPVKDLKFNETPYLSRGWCQAETEWASLRETLSHMPSPPSKFQEKMGQLAFTHRNDAGAVIQLQARVFFQKTSATTQLLLEGLDEAQVRLLCEVLPSYTRLEDIVLNGNVQLGTRGAVAAVQSAAKFVHMESCGLQSADAKAMAEALSSSKDRPHLELLNLKGNFIDEEGQKALERVRRRLPNLQIEFRGQLCPGDVGQRMPSITWSVPRATVVAVQIPTDTVLDYEGPLLIRNFPGVVLRMQKLEFAAEAITAETFESAAKNIRKAAETILPHKFSAIGLSCTSMSFVLGPKRVDEQLNSVCPTAAVTDMARAQVASLRALRATRLALVTPYIQEVAAKNVQMLEEEGFEVVSHATMGLTHDSQTDKVSKDTIKAWAHAVDTEAAEVLVIGCSALRACEPGFIEDLEAALGKPVVTSTQAFLWSLLRAAGIDDKIGGYGTLFAQH